MRQERQLRTEEWTAAPTAGGTASMQAPLELGIRTVDRGHRRKDPKNQTKEMETPVNKAAKSAAIDFGGFMFAIFGLALVVFALYTGYLYF